jgi:membrane associated rhomboid family serine protease
MSNYRNFQSGFLGGMIPPFIKTLFIINVGIFLAQILFLDYLTIGGIPIGRAIINLFALQPVYSGYFDSFNLNHFWLWQLISYQFLHGGLWHLFFNMFSLWMFGMELENQWGSTRFGIYYLLSGIGAGLTQLFISPLLGPTGPTIGASGAIYGILLAFGMTFPNRPIFMFPFFIPIPAKIFVIIFAGIELFSGLTGSDGVAHFAHLGGALTGFLLILFGDKIGLMPFLEKLFKSKGSRVSSQSGFFNQEQQTGNQPGYFRVNWQKPQSPKSPEYFKAQEEKSKQNMQKQIFVEGEEITQRKIDEILDKITSEGYQNLSERERKILTELSKRL